MCEYIIKEYRRAAYITLLTSDRLNAYLADIDRQVQERMERLAEQIKRAQGTRVKDGKRLRVGTENE